MSKSLGNVVRPLDMQRALRHGRVPLLPAARDGVRPRRDVQRGRVRHARQRRPRQQPRQPASAARWRCSSATSAGVVAAARRVGAGGSRARRHLRHRGRGDAAGTWSSSRSIAPSKRCGARSTPPTSTSSRRRRSRSPRNLRPCRAPARCCITCSKRCSRPRCWCGRSCPETSGRMLGIARSSDRRDAATLASWWGTTIPDGHVTRKPEILFHGSKNERSRRASARHTLTLSGGGLTTRSACWPSEDSSTPSPICRRCRTARTLIDSHCHLDMDFDADREAVLAARARPASRRW